MSFAASLMRILFLTPDIKLSGRLRLFSLQLLFVGAVAKCFTSLSVMLERAPAMLKLVSLQVATRRYIFFSN